MSVILKVLLVSADIPSETFYYHAIQDGYLLPDAILG
jgi:hypothetical protein